MTRGTFVNNLQGGQYWFYILLLSFLWLVMQHLLH